MKRLSHYIISAALIFCLTVTADAAQMLIPVGQVVGLELVDNTVTVPVGNFEIITLKLTK